jgi:hypothetical protein
VKNRLLTLSAEGHGVEVLSAEQLGQAFEAILTFLRECKIL